MSEKRDDAHLRFLTSTALTLLLMWGASLVTYLDDSAAGPMILGIGTAITLLAAFVEQRSLHRAPAEGTNG